MTMDSASAALSLCSPRGELLQPRPLTLDEQLRRSAALWPGKAAILEGERSLSYQELLERGLALARLLQERGVGKGDLVGCLVNKTTEAILGFLGIAVGGGVFFPLDPNQPVAGLRYTLELARPKAVLVAEEYLPQLDRAAEGLEGVHRVVIGRAPAGCTAFAEHEARLSLPGLHVALQPDDPLYLNFTSGTTGRPKGALTTHANVFWNTRAAVETFAFTADDVHLAMFPAFVHPHELIARPILLGGSMVLLDTVQPKSIAATVARHRVTAFMAVASIYETLVRLGAGRRNELATLRVAESGGMHVTRTLAQAFKDCYGLGMYPVWGSTETAGIALATPWSLDGHEATFRPGSMGKPCPYYLVRVVDEDGRDTEPDEVGELLVGGPAVCPEYFNNPLETQRHLGSGWFRTGDLVSRDADGYFHFQTRRSGMMKVGGMKVFPIEVEEVLRAHPDVLEAAVVKVRTDLHGEIPRAVVVPRPGAELTRADVRKYCEAHLHRYKVPREIEFRDQLPRTPGGKIAWKEL